VPEFHPIITGVSDKSPMLTRESVLDRPERSMSTSARARTPSKGRLSVEGVCFAKNFVRCNRRGRDHVVHKPFVQADRHAASYRRLPDIAAVIEKVITDVQSGFWWQNAAQEIVVALEDTG
jgi:hypothetical protein